jgi:tetratricopeptide (TPR) repeat protein
VSEHPRIEDLRRRVLTDPASIAFAQLAEEYRRAGRFQESVDACCAGLVLHPGYLSARVTLGRALIELGDLDQAQRELETVLKSAPENLSAVRGIADILFKRGALAEALECYRKALSLARNDPELEQTVADLTQRLTPSKRVEPKDGLSFEQVQRELSARVSAPQVSALKSVPPRLDDDAGERGQPAVKPPAPSRKPAPAPPLALRLSQAERHNPEAAPAEPQRARRIVAALEQWLDAIHVARAHGAP